MSLRKILDNYEQVQRYAEYTVALWARKAPRLRMLVTSRHRLEVSGEAVVEVVMDAEGRFVTGKVLPTKQQGEGVAVQDTGGKAIDLIRRPIFQRIADQHIDVTDLGLAAVVGSLMALATRG